MNETLLFILCGVISYFLGGFNGAILISRFILRSDVREHGSGNAGLTNFYRTYGGWLAFGVIASDVLKMVLAVIVGSRVLDFVPAPLPALFAGACCIVGHVFPVLFGFKGGKGILSAGTLVWMVDWRVGLIVWGAFVLAVLVTRWVSLGSVAAGALFPVGIAIFHPQPVLIALAVLTGGLIIFKHGGNLKRLFAGSESKFSFRRNGTEGTE